MRALICAGGDPPEKNVFLQYAKSAGLIVAADAGVDWLFKYGVPPDVMVGDFDSAKPTALKTFKLQKRELIAVEREKDQTDTYLAAEEVVRRGAGRAVLFGCMGGRDDHTYANYQTMLYLLRSGVKPVMVDKRAAVYMAKESAEIVGDVGETFSILPFMGEAVVSVADGRVQYPLNRLRLPADYPVGISNVMESTHIRLTIHSGVVLIFVNNNKKKPR